MKLRSKDSQKTSQLSFQFNNSQISWIVQSLETTFSVFQVTALNSTFIFTINHFRTLKLLKIVLWLDRHLRIVISGAMEKSKRKRVGRVGRGELKWFLLSLSLHVVLHWKSIVNLYRLNISDFSRGKNR